MIKIPVIMALLFSHKSALSQIRQPITPDTLPPLSKNYSQAVASVGGRTVYVAGQVSVDTKGSIIGTGDFPVQVEQTFKNFLYVLKSAGASMGQVVKINYYIVDLDSTRLAQFRRIVQKYAITDPPTSTLIGVKALYNQAALIEIEGIAVTPKQ